MRPLDLLEYCMSNWYHKPFQDGRKLMICVNYKQFWNECFEENKMIVRKVPSKTIINHSVKCFTCIHNWLVK